MVIYRSERECPRAQNWMNILCSQSTRAQQRYIKCILFGVLKWESPKALIRMYFPSSKNEREIYNLICHFGLSRCRSSEENTMYMALMGSQALRTKNINGVFYFGALTL